MRTYEVMMIVRPDVVEDELDKLVTTIEGHIGTAGGTLKNTERMGKRRLAYEVRGFNDGTYVLFNVEGEGKIIAEVERRMRVTEPVIKFITVRVDEEQKRLDKVKKLRASRQRRPPALPAEPVPTAEAAPSGPEAAPASV
jgi:small subunit ribosomal protein S6